jgi:hypothetical protein
MATLDTAFLIDTVGEVLSKGIAATALAQPGDPVDYLAQWLLRCAQQRGTCGIVACMASELACSGRRYVNNIEECKQDAKARAQASVLRERREVCHLIMALTPREMTRPSYTAASPHTDLKFSLAH